MIEPKGRAGLCLPAIDQRLQDRYAQLVKEHLQVSQSVASGLNALPGVSSSFASTQAAWRFYHNEATTLPVLAQPLLDHARQAARESCRHRALVMHDWSHLNYGRHRSKSDCVGEGKSGQRGYELQTALLVCDHAGEPLAPLCQNIVTATGVYASRAEKTLARQPPLDEMTDRMEYLDQLSLGRELVHIVDREGDSVGHFRQWQAHQFLVRVKGGQRVEWNGKKCLLHEVVKELKQSGALSHSREVEFHGRAAQQHVAQTTICLSRPAQPRRKGEKRKLVAGAPISLRLVISEVRDEQGKILAVWLLLSNVHAAVEAAQLALWYYWRWRIESFFKLLKGAGWQIEHWQQENGLAIAKRLLVASMACVLMWQLARHPSAEAGELRRVLVRLSGRQIKRAQEFTIPAMLEGTWILLAMLDLLEQYDLPKLKQLAQTLFKPK